MFYEMDSLFIINDLMFEYLENLNSVLFVFLFNFHNYIDFIFLILYQASRFYRKDYQNLLCPFYYYSLLFIYN